ncbi:MAG: HAMP domain-containing protein [Nitrospirae bacterium]|nr:HAMP domain-containing protein [Nitrospirota bacterium]
MTLSIRWKVTLGALLAVTLGMTVAGWLAFRSIERVELSRVLEALEVRTNLAAFSLQPLLAKSGAGQSVPSQEIQSMARELSREARARVTVIAPDGTVLADSDTPDDAVSRLENHRARPEVMQAMATGRGTDIRLSATLGQRMHYLALPITSGARVSGIVRLALPLTALEARIRDLERAVGIAFGLAFVVSVALSVLLARGLTRPLSDMAAVARQLATGALGQRIHTTSRDEVGVLAATLNQMADQLEAKIREVSEDRAQLLAMLTSMVEGVMVLDCRGKVLQVNPALEQMFMVHGAEARGRAHWEVIRHHELNELAARVLETRQNCGGELTMAASGRTVRVEASVAGGQRENEACVVLVFRDITALRRLEKVRKDFVANVSHELRTPLTSIKGYVEALLDGAKDDPQNAVRFLDIILKQSDRLNLILEDLLQLSQIESGEILFKRDPVRLQAVVERTMASIKPLADKKNHSVTVDVPGILPPVLGDEDRLVQVMTNLLDNAVKYTPPNGSIQIAGRMADDPDRGTVELSVTDTGLGIPEADRPRVFERFYRVDKARSRELGGTGLGLAIVKHIVEGHGGQVWVEGNLPVGSRFVVRLPAVRQSEQVTQLHRENPT